MGFSLLTWHGMSLKSGDKINEIYQEEPKCELEYEVSSAEPWDDTDGWMSADEPVSTTRTGEPSASYIGFTGTPEALEPDRNSKPDEGKTGDFEDLEMLMSKIGNMRSSLMLMPDFQRKEITVKLAMKMVVMFGDGNGGEEGFD
ncbi:unnamed protein product [Fraxinus pennsylvanica]|uniref:Uncharacterized protein n=1 Tax=Fraxinus pennsylvanica TaxID=56036 RepID=A0AAD1ZCG7_9LAMI|nr:unnamed protein product [Fraxinus pennsylvanica]